MTGYKDALVSEVVVSITGNARTRDAITSAGHVLIGTPHAIFNLYKHRKKKKVQVDFSRMKLLVADEADELMNSESNFLKTILMVLKLMPPQL